MINSYVLIPYIYMYDFISESPNSSINYQRLPSSNLLTNFICKNKGWGCFSVFKNALSNSHKTFINGSSIQLTQYIHLVTGQCFSDLPKNVESTIVISSPYFCLFASHLLRWGEKSDIKHRNLLSWPYFKIILWSQINLKGVEL